MPDSPGEKITVHTLAASADYTGFLLYASHDVIILSVQDYHATYHPRAWSSDSIAAITFYSGSAGTGALIGGVAGVLFSFPLLALGEDALRLSYQKDIGKVIVPFFIVTTAVFTGIGALIGAQFPSTEKVWLYKRGNYDSLLPILQERMCYKHGLPPELKQQYGE
jgi:hypothetical protein